MKEGFAKRGNIINLRTSVTATTYMSLSFREASLITSTSPHTAAKILPRSSRVLFLVNYMQDSRNISLHLWTCLEAPMFALPSYRDGKII